MENDFKVGDVVCCVDDGPCRCCGRPMNIQRNGLYRIIGFGPGNSITRAPAVDTIPAVHTAGHPGKGCNPNRFKHLPKADDTFINQMRSLKPAKEKTS